MQSVAENGFDRRSIPTAAREGEWIAPDGHVIRIIDWPAPPEGAKIRGNLLFMAGRGDVYEKYLESFEHWRLRGWQVSAADWRGQGGSGRLSRDGRTGHIDDFLQWVGDLSAFWSHWSASRTGPKVLAAHSMGGHLCLRAVIENALTPQPDALVLTAPMLDVFPEHVPIFAKRLIGQVMAAVGDPTRPAWKVSERPATRDSARQVLLTHDDARYDDEAWWRDERPQLRLGPGSWGWVREAARSTTAIFRRGALESVTVPVLIIGTDADRLVSPAAIRRAAQRLPHVETLIFGPEARHEILREVDAIRDVALARIDEFLDRKVKG